MSSVGLEVMASGKPLVIYNPYDNPTPYHSESGVFVAYNVRELAMVVGEIIDGRVSDEYKKVAKAFVYDQVYKLDGKAADRIASLIVETVNRKDG